MLPIVLDRMLGGCSGRVPLLSIESAPSIIARQTADNVPFHHLGGSPCR